MDEYEDGTWTEAYPIGSVWKFSGNVWGKGKAIVIGYNIGSLGTKSLWMVKVSEDGRVVADSVYENQKHILRKRLDEPASVDALLGWTKPASSAAA